MGNRLDNLSTTRIICIWDSRNGGIIALPCINLLYFLFLFSLFFIFGLGQDKGIFID